MSLNNNDKILLHLNQIVKVGFLFQESQRFDHIFFQTLIMSDYSEQQESSDYQSEEQTALTKQKPKKKKIVFLNSHNVPASNSRITINLALTHYDVIQDVAEQLEWKIQRKMKTGKTWDILWTDHHIQPDLLIKLQLYQKVSHFPGIHVLSRKNLLGLSFMDMYKRAPEHYNFFPKTWLLPAQFAELRKQFMSDEKEKTFIVKPEADCQGRGIFLTQKIEEVGNGGHYVVQEYISRPLLIDNLKFDFRVYVLLCGVSPLRLYVYQQGLARFATEAYAYPNKNNLKKQYVHLTNYAINKKNPKFIYNSSNQRMDVGHKRSLTSVLKVIQKRGYNMKKIKAEINDVLVKTMLLGHPLAAHQYRFCQPHDQNRNMCFHILGIDIMLDEDCRPIVLEVNHTPSFVTDTPLDRFIKFSLIKDTLILMNINSSARARAVQKINKLQKQKNLGRSKRQLYQNLEKQEKVKEAQQQRSKYQSQNLGGFTRIFPVEDPQQLQLYESLLELAEKSYFSQNNVLRAQMERQKASQESTNKDRDREEKQKQKEDKFKKTLQQQALSTLSPPKLRKFVSGPDRMVVIHDQTQGQNKLGIVRRERVVSSIETSPKKKNALFEMKQLEKELVPFRQKNQHKPVSLSIKKSPSYVTKNGYSKLLPKIGQDSIPSPLLKKQLTMPSPYRNKKMRMIKLVDEQKEKTPKKDDKKLMRNEGRSKILKKNHEQDSQSQDEY